MKNYSDFGIDIPYSRTSGQIKAICPHCHEQRRDKRDKSLSVNLDKGVWNCHYCDWHGTVNVGKRTNYLPKRTYTRPVPVKFSAFTPKCLKWFSDRGISDATLNKMVELQTVNGQFIPHFLTFDEDGEIVCATPRKIDNGFCIGQGEFDFNDFCLDYVAEAKDRDRAVATLFNAQALILLRAREVYLKIGVIKEVAPYWFNEMLHLNSLYEHHVRMLVKHRDLYKSTPYIFAGC